MDDRLGVTARLVDVAVRLELGTDLRMVVDLAVEHDLNGAVLVGQRLMSLLQIDDAQAAMSESGPFIAINPRIVRSTMRDDVAHQRQPRAFLRAQPIGGDDAGDAAHARWPPRSARARRAPGR